MKLNTNFTDRLATFECVRCETFLIDGSLSTAEQERQMIDHLDTAHPYWDFEDLGVGGKDHKTNFRQVTTEKWEYFCIDCRTVITPHTSVCPHCGADTSQFIESSEEEDELGPAGIDRKQLFGIIGSILLFFGVFTPIISAPIIGNVNYFQNGKGDGVIVLILAVISFGLVLAKKYGGLWITATGSLVVMVFTFVNFQIGMSQMQEKMERDLAGNPFRGIADVAMQSIQIEWGWALLIIGAALLVTAAAIRDKAY